MLVYGDVEDPHAAGRRWVSLGAPCRVPVVGCRRHRPPRLQDLSTNRVDSGGLAGTPEERGFARNRLRFHPLASKVAHRRRFSKRVRTVSIPMPSTTRSPGAIRRIDHGAAENGMSRGRPACPLHGSIIAGRKAT